MFLLKENDTGRVTSPSRYHSPFWMRVKCTDRFILLDKQYNLLCTGNLKILTKEHEQFCLSYNLLEKLWKTKKKSSLYLFLFRSYAEMKIGKMERKIGVFFTFVNIQSLRYSYLVNFEGKDVKTYIWANIYGVSKCIFFQTFIFPGWDFTGC